MLLRTILLPNLFSLQVCRAGKTLKFLAARVYTRHSFLDDKITERLFRDVNRRYLTNRCIGAAFLPFLPFSSARIGRRV